MGRGCQDDPGAEYVRVPEGLQSGAMASTASELIGSGVTVLPGGCVSGEVYAPGSKSLAQRYLLAAFLAEGQTQIRGLPQCRDVESLSSALSGLSGGDWGPGGACESARWPTQGSKQQMLTLSVGESGTSARLLTACVALGGRSWQPVRVMPEGTLASRTSPALMEALIKAGAHIRSRPTVGVTDSPGWPLEIEPVVCPPRLSIREPSSSQEVSALLFALAAGGGGTLAVEGAIPSAPYLRMTESVLSEFGVEVDEVNGLFTVKGTLRAPATEIAVEPDASAAAVMLAAGCVSGGKVRVAGLTSGSVQGDIRIIEHLRAFGCRGAVDARGAVASGIPCRGARLDLSGEPDLAPILAAVGAIACLHSGEACLLEGLGTLEGKESPRLSGVAHALSRLGWQVRTGPDWLSVDAAPEHSPAGVEPTVLDPAGDHRMAFTFALLGLSFTGVRITGCDCVGKSYPNFWEDLKQAGANTQP